MTEALDLTNLLSVKLNGRLTNVSLNSGSCISLIDADYACELGVKAYALQPGDVVPLYAVDGIELDTRGKCTVALQHQQNKINHEFVLVKNNYTKCSLGGDFLDLNGASMDFGIGTVRIHGLGTLNFLRLADIQGSEEIGAGVIATVSM